MKHEITCKTGPWQVEKNGRASTFCDMHIALC
jgi:hypothetical protein